MSDVSHGGYCTKHGAFTAEMSPLGGGCPACGFERQANMRLLPDFTDDAPAPPADAPEAETPEDRCRKFADGFVNRFTREDADALLALLQSTRQERDENDAGWVKAESDLAIREVENATLRRQVQEAEEDADETLDHMVGVVAERNKELAALRADKDRLEQQLAEWPHVTRQAIDTAVEVIDQACKDKHD